jgi:hypothetical protein
MSQHGGLVQKLDVRGGRALPQQQEMEEEAQAWE